MSYGSRKNRRRLTPTVSEDNETAAIVPIGSEKAFRRMIRSQDTCSSQKADDSWVGELAFFVDILCLCPSAIAEGAFLFPKKR